MLQSFVTASQSFIAPEFHANQFTQTPFKVPDFSILQTTTSASSTTSTTASTTTTSLDILKYGAVPTEPWGWIDFVVGLLIGGYFPARDHIQ